ncbi:hypothetical protein MAL1_00211 [Bacteriophage DSS3_MAL1]|nr:hypothetical protein MAL1_00211 [Bacteriophage DSS3_MAL1]
MNLYARIEAHEAEEEALDTILSPVYDKLLRMDGVKHNGFCFTEAATSTGDNIVLYGEDYRDGEERSFTIPASVIEGDLDGWIAQREEEKKREKFEAELEAKRKELERLEARTRILRGELSNG